MSIGIENK